jgi:hypothetical protein
MMGFVALALFLRALPSMPSPRAVLLTPPVSVHSRQLPSRQQPASVNPLEATLPASLASAANKRLTKNVSPVDATLTKNWRERTPNAQLSNDPRSNFFPLTSLAVPHPLTPIESHPCKNHRGEGVFPTFQRANATPVFATLTKTPGCIPTLPILGRFLHRQPTRPSSQRFLCALSVSALSVSGLPCRSHSQKKQGGGRNHRLAPPCFNPVGLYRNLGLTTRGLSDHPWPASPRSWPAPWRLHPVSASGGSWSGSAPCRQWCPCSQTDPHWSARP